MITSLKRFGRDLVVVGATFAALALGGCGLFDNPAQQSTEEPKPENIINGTNTQVIQMPEGFRNVAFTCYGTDGVFVTSRGPYQAGMNADGLPSSIYVVPNDPHCTTIPK